MKFIPIFVIGFLILSTSSVFAQNFDANETQNIKEESEDSLNKQILNINEKQNEIIKKLKENEIYIGTVARNIDDSLLAASTSFWYSASLTTVIAVGLAIIGIVVSTWLTVQPVTKEVGTSRKYAFRWIGLGIIIGLLGYLFVNTLKTVFGF